jgi:hypothetical protein
MPDYWLGNSNVVRSICREVIEEEVAKITLNDVRQLIIKELKFEVTQESHNKGDTYHTVQPMLGAIEVGEPIRIELTNMVDGDDLLYDLEIT